MMGHGVAKIDGAVIFVQNAVAGDEALIRIIKSAKNYYVARIEDLIVPSPNRVKSKCAHARACGGCVFQHVTYEHELALKKEYVSSCLRRSGLHGVNVFPVLSTGKLCGYRNKGSFPVSKDKEGNVFCGFYSQKSHSVCRIDSCEIQNPAFAEITEAVCRFLTDNHVSVYSEESCMGLVRHVYLRIGEATGQIMLCLVLKEDAFAQEDAFVRMITSRFPSVKSIWLNFQPDDTNVILGKQGRLLYGAEKIEDVLCGKPLMISPKSFYQVNHDAAELLYQTAFEMANARSFDHVVDLYCGIGSISLSLPQISKITGIEIVPEAIVDAKENAALCKAENAEFICGDAAELYRLSRQDKNDSTLVIVDPPRKGLSQTLISDFAKNGVKSVLYISCGPDTFARDLAHFSALGYEIGAVQPVDLFPRTGHVECITVLEHGRLQR